MNVLWRNTTGSEAAQEKSAVLDRGINLIVDTDKESSKKHFAWMDILVDGNPGEEALTSLNLKHVIVPFVGINKDLREGILKHPHLKLYNSHFNDAAVAQHTLALLLAVSNHIPEANSALHQGNWLYSQMEPVHSIFLEDKVCLLLGYGAIGKATEKRLKGFGMTITALKRTTDATSDIKIYHPDQLHEALAEADVVISSLPSTPATKGMLNEAAFKAMKSGSILINVGRADVIDQHALYGALKSKHLFGAGLDVWWNYPKGKESRKNTFPSDAPLHELNNLVMSPHRAAAVQNWQEGSFLDTAKTINTIARGESRNEVDPNKGY